MLPGGSRIICFLGWICTMRILHNASLRQDRIYLIDLIYLICPICAIFGDKLIGVSAGCLFFFIGKRVGVEGHFWPKHL